MAHKPNRKRAVSARKRRADTVNSCLRCRYRHDEDWGFQHPGPYRDPLIGIWYCPVCGQAHFEEKEGAWSKA